MADRIGLRLVCVIGLFTATLAQVPEVNVRLGRIQGKTETVQRGSKQYTVKEFLGIPFAKPPVGDLRFRNPVAAESLGSNPYNASYYRSYCPHTFPGQDPYTAATNTEDEDCLYLNVFVPISQSDMPAGHAVMFWIYGGGFVSGAASDYHGSMLAAAGNVIVVSTSYRIGMLGFLSTMDSNAPGNYGLFDQALAIEWVHENIAAFGGDVNRVTIFGESAGGMSVSMQGLYEGNYGKIQRIISQSGTANTPFLDYTKDNMPATRMVAENLMCPTEDNYELIECLRKVPWKQFKDKLLALASDPANQVLLTTFPTIDGQFVKSDQRNLSMLLESSQYSKVEYFRSLDLLIGFNAYEGSVSLASFLAGSDPEQFEPSQDDMEQYIIDIMTNVGLFRGKMSADLRKTIHHEYTNWTNPNAYESVRLQFVKMMGDLAFAVPAVETARIHATDGNLKRTYMYHFKPATSFRMPWTPSWLPGADHAEEIGMIFGSAYTYLQSWEQELSDRMVTHWINFAKTGNPNAVNTGTGTWPPYNGTHQAYMELDKSTGSDPVQLYFAAKETDFWTEVIPRFMDAGTNKDVSDCHDVTSGSGALLSTLGVMIIIAVYAL